MNRWRAYSEEEDRIIREGHSAGLTDQKIADEILARTGINRTLHGIEARRNRCLDLPKQPERDIHNEKLTQSKKSDAAFQRALLRATLDGAERAVPGTFVDDTPFTATRYCPELMTSGCGSPSGFAADMGGR